MTEEPTECTCGPRPNTEGCTELSCPYHGAENRAKRDAQLAACPRHSAAERRFADWLDGVTR